MKEVWKPVVGFEGCYEVSDQGRVRSLARRIVSSTRWGGTTSREIGGRILAPCRCSNGYLFLQLGRGNARLIHRLVAAAFLGPCPLDKEVCHVDGDRANNAAQNLRYDTHRSNLADRARHGTHHYAHPNRKLSLAAARDIRRRRNAGVLLRVLAAEYGVGEPTIHCAAVGKTWKHADSKMYGGAS